MGGRKNKKTKWRTLDISEAFNTGDDISSEESRVGGEESFRKTLRRRPPREREPWYTRMSVDTDDTAEHNDLPPQPSGIYVNGLWIPSTEIERMVKNGELPPPPYGPAIPPSLGPNPARNVFYYYCMMKAPKEKEMGSPVSSEDHSGDTSPSTASDNQYFEENEEYIPVIYASSQPAYAKRPFRQRRIRRRRFLENDYVDLESDNCDIITKITPKNYRFILSLDESIDVNSEESEKPRNSVTPSASDDLSEELTELAEESAVISHTQLAEQPCGKTVICTIEETESEEMYEDFAQRTIDMAVKQALNQVVDEETNCSRTKDAELEKPGCSGISSTEIYAENIAQNILGNAIGPNKRLIQQRPPPIVIEDSINAMVQPEEANIHIKAQLMAQEILSSALKSPCLLQTSSEDVTPIECITVDTGRPSEEVLNPIEVPPQPSCSALAGVKQAIQEQVRERTNFLDDGATCPDPTGDALTAPYRSVASENLSVVCQQDSVLEEDQLHLENIRIEDDIHTFPVQQRVEARESDELLCEQTRYQGIGVGGVVIGSVVKELSNQLKETQATDSGVQSEVDDDEHVVFAVTPTSTSHSVQAKKASLKLEFTDPCSPSVQKSSIKNLTNRLPLLSPEVKASSGFPFGLCCCIM